LKDYGLLNTAIGFTIAVFMLVFIEKSYSMVMERVPKSGGEYSFANDLLGKKTAFVTGWGLLLAYISIIPLNATAVPMVLDKVFPSYSKGSLLYTVSSYEVFSNDVLVSLSIIIFFIIINLRGLKDAALAQKICVFALVFSLMVITLFTFGSIG
ncbi:APC family permease, partial [Leptospira borgpetersenii serovar Balcanica]|nr:APC family permease [Leptospira borgpetersenii serovar Balcanica]